MQNPSRVAFIGNSLPRRCGISTFTTELFNAIGGIDGQPTNGIVAMTEADAVYAYPANVIGEIHDNAPDDYLRAADLLNGMGVDVACLQHEFGIFGGEAGQDVMALLAALDMPLVTTLHTVLARPSPLQRQVIQDIARQSAAVVVMSRHGHQLLREVYGIDNGKLELVPHGVPDVAFLEPDAAKAKLGFAGRSVVLTFGLLSPGKGIETIIDAMPEIVRQCPDAIYVVLGATHPHLVRSQGESYRNGLIERVHQAGLTEHVVFRDRFVDRAELLEFITMCDVYATPYLDPGQTTSGTLAYSYGMGKAIASSTYGHASELLAQGRGILLAPGDAPGFAREIGALLTDHDRRNAMRRQAYADSRTMTWPRIARRYLDIFTRVRGKDADTSRSASVIPLSNRQPRAHTLEPPTMQTEHFLSLCDDTGMFQHAVHSIANRDHGYCLDDNARALLLACALDQPGETSLPPALVARLAAFVQHAWNPGFQRFRNFMDFQRRWLDERGSEDSHGRALWALGVCAGAGIQDSRRDWATKLFQQALPAIRLFRSPRAWAFTLLGMNGFCSAQNLDQDAAAMRDMLIDRFMALFAAVKRDDWVWFETGMAYDNARLSQALILTGRATGNQKVTEVGLHSLRWLMEKQVAAGGWFRPFGTDGFGDVQAPFKRFDQQPIEAAASVSACLAAYAADGNPLWRHHAWRAFDWFMGMNDLGTALVDRETGACRDGLHKDRANENRGAESTLSYLLALAEVRQLVHSTGDQHDAKTRQMKWLRP